MTLEEKLLSLKIEGFYIEESVLSPTQAAESAALTPDSARAFSNPPDPLRPPWQPGRAVDPSPWPPAARTPARSGRPPPRGRGW